MADDKHDNINGKNLSPLDGISTVFTILNANNIAMHISGAKLVPKPIYNIINDLYEKGSPLHGVGE